MVRGRSSRLGSFSPRHSRTSASARTASASTSPPEAKAFGIESSVSRDTALIELGGALDYALDENFLIGGHTGLNFITASGGGTFLTLGAQASYRF